MHGADLGGSEDGVALWFNAGCGPGRNRTYEKAVVKFIPSAFPYGYDTPIRARLPMSFYLEPAPNQGDGA